MKLFMKRGLSNCKYNTVSKSQLLKLIEQGFSMRAAAKQVNLPYSTFRKCCSYHKIEYNSSTSVQHPLWEDENICWTYKMINCKNHRIKSLWGNKC